MSSEITLKQFYQAISEMGRLEIAKRRAEGETMHLAPFGFKNVRVNDRSTITPDPETFPLAMMALQMRRGGSTLREICEFMAKRGLRSKRGKPIQTNGMHKILKTFSRLVETA